MLSGVSVIRHGSGEEALGRFAPSLKNMTRVVWNSTLETYAGMTLAEIARSKRMVRNACGPSSKCSTEFTGSSPTWACRNIWSCESFLFDRQGRNVGWSGIANPRRTPAQEILEAFVNPLLAQIRIDATRQIASLAENRLGINGPVSSVRQAARTMGLTRARVYQLLNEINDIMNVRWPLGRHQVYELSKKFQADSVAMVSPPDLTRFRARH